MTGKCICTTLRQAAAFSTAHYDAALAPSGLKITMFRLLRRIDAAGELYISRLADIVGLDRSTLGRNLRVLERQALVHLSTGTDGRVRRIVLTDKGRAALETAYPLWQAAQTEFASLIGPDVAAALEQIATRQTGTGAAAEEHT